MSIAVPTTGSQWLRHRAVATRVRGFATTLTSAALDRLLAVLVVAMTTTGLVTLRVGHPAGAWLFAIHGLLAGVLAGALVVKIGRSLPRAFDARRAKRIGLSLVVTLVAAAALTGGWLWVASGEIVWIDAGAFGRWTILTLHAWLGLALLPLLAIHLVPRRWRLLRPGPRTLHHARGLLSRRSMLTVMALGVLGLGSFAGATLVDRLRGGRRRFTGSRWLPPGAVPPATTFFGEPTPPSIDHAAWQVRVQGALTRPRVFGMAELRGLAQHETAAVLDCTSGWALEARWRGVAIATVLEACGLDANAREVAVTSMTGWSAAFSSAEAGGCLLAWEVAGQPLPDANGAPLRLVAPDRRGLDWVKWVDRIDVRT